MKKYMLIALLLMAANAIVFSQSYTVEEITGTAQLQRGGSWEALKTGDTIAADAVIRTLMGATLTVKSGGETATVGPMKNGIISELVGSSHGIRIQGTVSQTDTGATGRTAASAVTASARASDAAAGFEFEEE